MYIGKNLICLMTNSSKLVSHLSNILVWNTAVTLYIFYLFNKYSFINCFKPVNVKVNINKNKHI